MVWILLNMCQCHQMSRNIALDKAIDVGTFLSSNPMPMLPYYSEPQCLISCYDRWSFFVKPLMHASMRVGRTADSLMNMFELVCCAIMAGSILSVPHLCRRTSSNLMICLAETPIYSKLEALSWISREISLWVYETDVQILDKEVYKSDLTWPNKQHEVIYICMGMEAIRPVDKRCKSNNMTVIFTENSFQGHRQTEHGTVRKFLVKGFNDLLTQKEIEARAKICNSKCKGKRLAIIEVSSIGGLLLLAFILIFVIIKWDKIKACCCCYPNTTSSNTDSSASPSQTYYGELFHCSPLTAYPLGLTSYIIWKYSKLRNQLAWASTAATVSLHCAQKVF